MDTTKLNSGVTTINSLGFNNIWSGAAYDVQRKSLNDLMTKLNSTIEDVNKFDKALTLKEEYIKICKKLSSLYSTMRSCDLETEEGKSRYNSCSYQASQAEVKRAQLRTEILAILSGFSGIEAELTQMMDLNTDVKDLTFLFDINELVSFYASGAPKHYGGIFALYDQYEDGVLVVDGAEYVNQQIANIASQCTSRREVAVNVGLLLLQLCADKNVKLDYILTGSTDDYSGKKGLGQGSVDYYGGIIQTEWVTDNEYRYTYKDNDVNRADPNLVFNSRYNNIYQIERGTDCCSMVSYIVNVATAEDPTVSNPEGFRWNGVAGMRNFGAEVSIENAQPGDVFVYEDNAHTGMFIEARPSEEDPNTGKIIILESGGKRSDYGLNEYNYTVTEDGRLLIGGSIEIVLLDFDKVYSGEVVS